MAARSVALLLGFVGGVAILLGGLVALLIRAASSSGVEGLGQIGFGLVSFVVAGILGFLVVLTSRPRLFWWPGRRLFNGILLVVLGVVAWVLVGGAFVLTAAGSILTIGAGVLLPVEAYVARGLGIRRRWFRRRWF